MEVLGQRRAAVTFALPLPVRLRIENPRQKRRRLSNELVLSSSVHDKICENYVRNICGDDRWRD